MSMSIVPIPKGCKDGYISPVTNQCVSKCPRGYYGYATYNRRGTLENSICTPCNSSCYECASNGDCLSCKFGFYLSTRGFRDRSYGICIRKPNGSTIT